MSILRKYLKCKIMTSQQLGPYQQHSEYVQMGAFKYLGERAGNTSVTGSKLTGASRFQKLCFQHKQNQARFICHLTAIKLDLDSFPEERSYQWPDLVSRIRFSQLPPIQTDAVRLCLILCIYHLTIRFPPGGSDTAIVGPVLCLLVIAVSSAV